MKKVYLLLILSFCFLSCNDVSVPRATSQLRLEYPEPVYSIKKSELPFSLETNSFSKLKTKENGALEIHYPSMKATVYLTYKPVKNNLENLLIDAQKLTYKLHVLKADEIVEQPYVNPDKKVYGMFYKVGGDAASNALFYATDSTKNFVTASVYFYTKPNFDSILPASSYITNDMKRMLETIKWEK
ncbi:gliding motility lipoprotein GldD [uncultured Flavobacterium sp.]|uniref:gliding motility lipoprotein GldD n=1 Tax=uncultured Flavobacterium sp. TaxID=165435 RepID=UPI0030CA1DD7